MAIMKSVQIMRKYAGHISSQRLIDILGRNAPLILLARLLQ